MYHKDAAYHNGTVWGWNAGPAVSGLVRFGYQDFAYRFTKNLAHQILHMGCRGAMSENADAIPRSSGKIRLTGTWSQAWSSSEFVRNAFQDYAGFMPELLEGRVTLAPVTPAAWNAYEAGYAFGTGNASLRVSFRREGTDECYRIHTTGHAKPLAVRFIGTAADRTRHALTVTLPPGKVVEVLLDSKAATFKVDGRSTPAVLWLASYSGEIGEPAFVVPRITQDYPALQKKDYLKQIVEQGEFR
jgi:hypothetical protein